MKTCEQLEEHSKELAPLHEGDTVFIQNQNMAYGKPNKWDREGTVVQTGDNDQYLVRVHGTGRVTLRNRRFLRKFVPRRDPECLESMNSPVIRDSLTNPSPNSTCADYAEGDPGTESPKLGVDCDHAGKQVGIPPDHSLLMGEKINGCDDSGHQCLDLPASNKPDASTQEEPTLPRRSARVPLPRKLYDAATGKYV